MLSKPQQYIAGALALVVLLGLAYCTGKNRGQIDEKLATNKTQLISQDSVTKLVTRLAEAERKKAITAGSVYTVRRYSVKVVHDTVTTPGGVYVDSTLARLITAADSTIAAQKRALALQDSLVGSLRNGIALRDTRIKLLESRGTSRISKGVQLGVGYCQNASGRTPCGYLGYGVQLRLP